MLELIVCSISFVGKLFYYVLCSYIRNNITGDRSQVCFELTGFSFPLGLIILTIFASSQRIRGFVIQFIISVCKCIEVCYLICVYLNKLKMKKCARHSVRLCHECRKKESNENHLKFSQNRNKVSNGSGTQSEDVCVICMDAEKTVVVMPCRHQCLCVQCSKRFIRRNCPICRAVIEETISVYR